MKATENTENINIISDKIIKWFDETFTELKTSKRNEVDLIVAAILLACSKYSLAILDLIGNKHIIPAQALLRVLLEIFAVSAWCLKPDTIEDKKIRQAHSRFKRWDFLRVKEHKKLLEILNSNQPEHINAIEELEKQIGVYKNQDIERLPTKRTVFEELAKGTK